MFDKSHFFSSNSIVMFEKMMRNRKEQTCPAIRLRGKSVRNTCQADGKTNGHVQSVLIDCKSQTKCLRYNHFCAFRTKLSWRENKNTQVLLYTCASMEQKKQICSKLGLSRKCTPPEFVLYIFCSLFSCYIFSQCKEQNKKSIRI